MPNSIEWLFHNRSLLLIATIPFFIYGFFRDLLPVIIRRIKQKESQIELNTEEEGANFFRACVSANDSTDKDTIIRPAVKIQNKNPGYIIIKKFRLKVLRPWKYRTKTTLLIPTGTEVRYREGQGTSPSTVGIHYTPALDREHKISAGNTERTSLSFRVPIIVDRATNELECILKIQTQDRQKASRKFVAREKGY